LSDGLAQTTQTWLVIKEGTQKERLTKKGREVGRKVGTKRDVLWRERDRLRKERLSREPSTQRVARMKKDVPERFAKQQDHTEQTEKGVSASGKTLSVKEKKKKEKTYAANICEECTGALKEVLTDPRA